MLSFKRIQAPFAMWVVQLISPLRTPSHREAICSANVQGHGGLNLSDERPEGRELLLHQFSDDTCCAQWV